MCRKDAFPGADGSTITQIDGNNASAIPIYGTSGNTLTEGSTTGLRFVNITTSGVLNGNTSLLYAIKNPLAFIYTAATPYDWYTNNELYQDGNLWSNSKSVYDPCPQGWNIAPVGTWNDFTITTSLYYSQGEKNSAEARNVTNGRLFNNVAWIPAEGQRHYASGLLYVSGQCGYIRSQSGHVLDCGMNFVKPAATYSLAYGMPVRCVQE